MKETRKREGGRERGKREKK
jgi:hypothetical protein